jgi:MFS family permease
MIEASRSYRSFLIFSILAILQIFSLFYRVSNAVIAPNLTGDLHLDAETLGILGGAFFYSFALLQIPMGPMLDRIGPRFVLTLFSFIGGLGAFIFAWGESFSAVLLGRILNGVGMAAILMGSLKVFTLRFPPGKFATLAGILFSIGTLGNVLAASPLAYLASTIGWRMAFFFSGVITTILAFLVFWVLGEEKGKEEISSPASSGQKIGILQSLRLVLGAFVFWRIAAIAFFRYGTFVALQGLWLGPYLMDIKGYSSVQAGNLLILLAVGSIVAGPIAGWLSDRVFHPKNVILWGAGLYTLSLIPLMGVMDIRGPFSYGLIFFFIGFSCGFGIAFFSYVRELFPIAISGTVMTLVNFFTMAGGAIFMPLLGKIIKSFPRTGLSYPAEAYHFSFLLCFLSMAASVIFYAIPRKKRSGDKEMK